MRRSNSRSAAAEAAYNGAIRRMVSLPRNIIGGLSRVMGQGMNLIGIGNGRRTTTHHQIPPNLPFQPSPEFPHNDYPYNSYSLPSPPPSAAEEWAFLTNFEQEFGTTHPFFYACKFMEALKMAEDEKKFVFLYLHSPEHPFTAEFCRGTLCSEVVIQFLDANFICWAGLSNRGEGLHLGSTLRPNSFPFCALIAPANGDNIAVLQQLEGPVSPAELVEILQGTIEEQGLAFGSGRAKEEEEKRRADRRLCEEQDLAYLAALHIDQEKERHKSSTSNQQGGPKSTGPLKQQSNKLKETTRTGDQDLNKDNTSGKGNNQGSLKQQSSKHKETTKRGEVVIRENIASGKGNAEVTQILIRFPNGERKEQSFMSTDKIKTIFRYIDSLGMPGIGNYRLVSNFPRKIYGVDQMGMTLRDSGLHPKASLFLELLSD